MSDGHKCNGWAFGTQTLQDNALSMANNFLVHHKHLM